MCVFGVPVGVFATVNCLVWFKTSTQYWDAFSYLFCLLFGNCIVSGTHVGIKVVQIVLHSKFTGIILVLYSTIHGSVERRCDSCH